MIVRLKYIKRTIVTLIASVCQNTLIAIALSVNIDYLGREPIQLLAHLTIFAVPPTLPQTFCLN